MAEENRSTQKYPLLKTEEIQAHLGSESICVAGYSAALPDKVKIYPIMALKAMTTKQSGGYRIWLFSRSLDVAGSGCVLEKTLKSACLSAGVHPKTYKNWLKESIEMNLVIRKSRNNGIRILIYKSVQKAAQIFGCDRVDSRSCFLDTQLFINGNWRSAVWGAYIQINFNHKMVSRELLFQLTGVDRFKQVRLEREISMEKLINVAQTHVDKSNLTGIRECIQPSAFVYKGEVAFRLPDTRYVTQEIKTSDKKRAKFINQSLKRQSNVSEIIGQELSNFDKLINVRLFFANDREVSRAFRRYSIKNIQAEQLFYLLPVEVKGGKANIWIPVYK